MIKDKSFINNLVSEMKEWVKEGLISSDQKSRIESWYTSVETVKPAAPESVPLQPKKEVINIARVVIGLATLCLAAGIIIFYASNWRKMPPVLKLIQIFILMFSIYGSAFFFLDPGRKHPAIGSALLLLGIISYGAGIMLVAQIYHISSHPTNGVLAWGAGALIVSAAARDKYGYYLSALLFFIWNFWEVTVFGSAGYLYIIPVLIIAFLLLEVNDRRGLTGSALLTGWYIFQVSLYWIYKYADDGWKGGLFILLFVLAGALLITASKFLKSAEELRGAGRVFRVCGWGLWFLPLLLSAHVEPYSGYSMFIWGAALLAASFLLKEYEGYYVSAAIFFLWSLTETGTRNVFPWLYIFPALVTGYLFYRRKDHRGIVITSLAIIWYFLLFTWHFASKASADTGIPDPFFIIMLLPAGAAMIAGGRFMSYNQITSSGGTLLHSAGWVAAVLPLFALSWPFALERMSSLMMFRNSIALSSEYLALTLCAAVLITLLKQKGEHIHLSLLILLFTAAGFVLPMGHTATRMVSLHIGIVVLAGALLYYSYSIPEQYRLERGIGVTFIMAAIIIKGTGFITYSGIDTKFRIAYLAGSILFVTVCFLLNRLLDHIIENRLYPARIIDSTSAVVLWISVYLSSFETGEQASILSADRIVIIMIILFAAMAALLYYLILTRIKTEHLMIYLSLMVLTASGITMFISGPDIPWQLYSVIFNLLLLIISATYIYYSTVIQSKILLNAAVAGFVIHIITRYFDLFWDMFSGALLFIITGFIGLFGGYILEKKRKDIAMQIEKETGRSDIEGVER